MKKTNSKSLAFVGVRLRGQKNFTISGTQRSEDLKKLGKEISDSDIKLVLPALRKVNA